MTKLMLALMGLFLFAGCTKSTTVTPIQSAGCSIETAISSGIAGAVSSSLQCANTAQVAADLQAAWGNVNLCSTAQAQMKSQKLQPKGIVASIVCPIAINTAVGFLSNSVPSSWKCTGPNATMAGLIGALTTACEAAPF